jgi:hypothetical protein
MAQWVEDIEASRGIKPEKLDEGEFRSVRDLVQGEHYKELCRRCGTLMSQCRCTSPDRSTVYGVCSNCQTPEEKAAAKAEMNAAIEEALASIKTAATKPSLPQPVDEYQPTDQNLWKTVLEVASGDRLKYERNDRTINAPNGTRGYRNMPHNPKGIAWAVKQYKGFGGHFKKATTMIRHHAATEGVEFSGARVAAGDKIPGGLADKGAPEDLDPKQLELGIGVEMEHTDDKAVAKEIALDHLTEDPEYYSKLKTIEKHSQDKALARQAMREGTVVKALGRPHQGRTDISKLAADSKYDHINFKPPEAVANAAKKGLEYRKRQGKDKAGLTPSEASKEGIGSGVQRATNLKNRDTISPEVIGQMVGFFARHQKNKGVKPEFKSEPWKDKGHVAWLLWGGDPGKTWAEKVKGQMEAADNQKKTAATEQRLNRMAAGGIEVTEGPDPELEKMAAQGSVRLASQDGLRWYWDMTGAASAAESPGENASTGVLSPEPALDWVD